MRLGKEAPTRNIVDVRQQTETNTATKRNLGEPGYATIEDRAVDMESAIESMGTSPDHRESAFPGSYQRPDRGAFVARPLNLMGGGLAPAESNNDDMDSFIMAAAETDNGASADSILDSIIGQTTEPDAGRPVDPEAAPSPGLGTTIGQTLGDVFYRAPQTGIRNAVQETINLVGELGNQLSELSDGTILDFAGRPVYQNGQWFPDVVADVTMPQLADTSQPVTTIGKVEKSLVQFVTSFALAGKFLKGIKAVGQAPAAIRATTQGFLAAFAGFDGHEERLSNLLTQSENPAFNNMVTQFLAASEEDTELEGRLKAGIEEMGFGLAAEGFVQALRALRSARRAKEQTGAKTFEEAARKMEAGESDIALRAENEPADKIDEMLGSTSDELVVKPRSRSPRVYHGTTQIFDQFDPSKRGTASLGEDAEEGFFFTTNPQTAEEYTRLMQVTDDDLYSATDVDFWKDEMSPEDFSKYEDLVRQYNETESEDVATQIKDLLTPYTAPGANIRPSYVELENPKIIEDDTRTGTLEGRKELIVEAKKAGHDGVIIKNTQDIGSRGDETEDLYIVFNEKSIKPAFNAPPGVIRDDLMSTTGEATAGMSPVQYGETTVHVNFAKMDTIDDVRATLDEIVSTGKVTETTAGVPVTSQISSLSDEQISALPKAQQDQYKFYIGKRRELVNEWNKTDVADPNIEDIDRRIRNLDAKMEATLKAELTGTARPGPRTGTGPAAPGTSRRPPTPGAAPRAPRVGRQAQAPDWDDATVPGAQQTWDMLIASRDARKARGSVDPLSANKQEALRVMWLSASNKLAEVIQTAKNAPTSENLFAFRKMLNTFGLINNEVRGIRQETGRAVNIWRKPDRIPMRRMKEIEEALERTGGITDNKDLLDKMAAHLTDPQGGGALALSNMAIAANRYGTVRALRSFWTLGLLTNWKTHEVNAISNTFTMFQMVAERAAAAQYSRMTGQVDGVAPGEAAAMLRGMWDNLWDAFTNAGRTFRTGEGGGAFQKVEMPFHHDVFEDPNTALKKFTNTAMWYWGGIGRGLQATDEFFKTLNHGAAVNAQIYRKVYNDMQQGKINEAQFASEVTRLKNEVPEDILLKAEDYARYSTFTKEPGKHTKRLARFLNGLPGGRYVVPFINTPSNLFQMAIERTPFVVFQKQFRDAIVRGGSDEAIAMTKLTMGMTIMSMGIAKTFDGEITGSGPPFWSKEYAQWKATGKQPYSIKVGDRWVSYNRFDPMGIVLGFGADLGEKLQYMDEQEGEDIGEWMNLAAGVTFSLAAQITSKSYMQSVSGLFDAINDPNMSAASFVSQFAGSFIPSGVGEVARQTDPVQRESYNFITKWKSRIPGMSKTLEPKLDMWAREIRHGTGQPFVDAVNPFYVTKENYMPIDQEFELQGWAIPPTIKNMTVDGAQISLRSKPKVRNFMLTTERQTQPSQMGDVAGAQKLIKKYGDYSMVDLMNMIVTGNHPLYRRYMEKTDGPDGSKVDMLKTIKRDYYEAAKEAALAKFPELQLDIINAQAKKAEQARDVQARRSRERFGDTQ